jgi:plastocyanin
MQEAGARGADARSRAVDRLPLFALLASLAVASCGGGLDGNHSEICTLDDADGVTGGSIVFQLTVDDTGFSPAILTAQDGASVTLTMHNLGASPHDFVVDCMLTPNANGCPTTSCFPAAAAIPPEEPGASASITFVTPRPEGIYYYHSSMPANATQACMAGLPGCGQFIVK